MGRFASELYIARARLDRVHTSKEPRARGYVDTPQHGDTARAGVVVHLGDGRIVADDDSELDIHLGVRRTVYSAKREVKGRRVETVGCASMPRRAELGDKDEKAKAVNKKAL